VACGDRVRPRAPPGQAVGGAPEDSRVSHSDPGRRAGAPPLPEKTDPRDEPLVAELLRLHSLFNEDQFNGRLRDVRIRVSRRMRSRLGHYTRNDEFGPAEIAISRRHIKRDGWARRRTLFCTRWCTNGRTSRGSASTTARNSAPRLGRWVSRRPRAER
jgi:hypothetical protein